jgi:hypothetical protein
MDVIVQPLSQRETQLNKLEQGKDVGVEFSALDIITFSQQVTAECIEVIKAPQTSWLLKLWSLARIINNFMNREAFFYIDLIFCVSFCIYNVLATRIMKSLEFYTVGALIVNCVFLWYFSYCRHLNGKDVITLRRSIQLLSHSFQLCTIGILVLCRENNNDITDDDQHDGQSIHHQFTCTSTFIFSNVVRIMWHFAVLFKSFIDEYASNFVITRGVMVDVITLIVSPPMIVFSLVTDICAVDIRSYLINALTVTYEVNDITNKTTFYLALDDSLHRNKLEPIVFFWILLSTDLFEYIAIEEEFCFGKFENDENVLYVIFYVMMCFGGMLMCEFFFCKQVKYCTAFFFLTVNLGARLWLAWVTQKVVWCWRIYDDEYFDQYDDYVEESYSSTEEMPYWKVMGTVIISGIVWLLFMFDNLQLVRRRHIWVFTDLIRLIVYVGVLCPLHPFYQFFVSRVINSTALSEGITAKISRTISMTIINAVNKPESTLPTPNPVQCNGNFTDSN